MSDVFVEMFFDIYQYNVQKYQLSNPAIVGINTTLNIFRSQDFVVDRIVALYEYWLSRWIVSEISFEWRCQIVYKIVCDSSELLGRNLNAEEAYLVLKLVAKLANYCNT